MIRVDVDKLRAIVESEDDDLRTLAHVAGGHPASFYRGANFNDADLRGQNLRGFNLEAATFERARVDRRTKADKKYHERIGMLRVSMKLPMGKAVVDALKDCDIKLEKPTDKHLGDILEGAAFKFARVSIPVSPFFKSSPQLPEAFRARDGGRDGTLKINALLDYMIPKSFTADIEKAIIRNPLQFKFSDQTVPISITSRTCESIYAMTGSQEQLIPVTCSIILLNYIAGISDKTGRLRVTVVTAIYRQLVTELNFSGLNG